MSTGSRDGPRSRALILDAIRREPGIHKSALCRQVGMGWGTVCYHLRVLKREAEVQVLQRGREVRLFPSGIPPNELRYLAALRDDVGSSILDALRSQPGLGLKDLVDELGHSRRILRRHLTLLNEDGIVTKEGVAKPRYQVKDEVAGGFLRGDETDWEIA